MTERPFILSIQNRLVLPHRQGQFVRRALLRRANGAKRLTRGSNPHGKDRSNPGTAVLNRDREAFHTGSDPTDNTLSP